MASSSIQSGGVDELGRKGVSRLLRSGMDSEFQGWQCRDAPLLWLGIFDVPDLPQ